MSCEGSSLEHGMWWKVLVILFLLVLSLVGTTGAGKEIKFPGQPKHVEYYGLNTSI